MLSVTPLDRAWSSGIRIFLDHGCAYGHRVCGGDALQREKQELFTLSSLPLSHNRQCTFPTESQGYCAKDTRRLGHRCCCFVCECPTLMTTRTFQNDDSNVHGHFGRAINQEAPYSGPELGWKTCLLATQRIHLAPRGLNLHTCE